MRDDHLTGLVDPAHTAVLTMEMQRGVIGDLAVYLELRDAAASSGTVRSAGEVVRAAHGAGARVVHCTVGYRPDGVGSALNCRILASAAERNGGRLDEGQPGTELIGGLNVRPADLIVSRSHGLTPFTSTGLDQILRNMGVRTVVAVGCSINIGILGLVLTAVDLGYQVVVASDAVVGVPPDYGRMVMSNTIALLATIVSSDELVTTWG